MPQKKSDLILLRIWTAIGYAVLVSIGFLAGLGVFYKLPLLLSIVLPALFGLAPVVGVILGFFNQDKVAIVTHCVALLIAAPLGFVFSMFCFIGAAGSAAAGMRW